MPDFSKDFQISYDDERSSCTIRFRCFDTPNSVTVFNGMDAHVHPDNAPASGRGCDSASASGRGSDASAARGSGATSAAARFDVEDVLLSVRRTCLELHKLWSFSLEESDVARMNRIVDRVQVDPRTARLVQAMKDFHAIEPSFDFTVGPVSFLWKHATQVPSAGELERALAHVGADKVSVEGDVVVKADSHAQVDVGGAAKGFAADLVVSQLRAAGITCADIDFGGNLYMMGGHPEGRPWRVAVRVPKGFELERPILEVRDCSVVTSGSYERFVEIDGKRYQHIVDARTGWPCESDIVSATVVSASSLQADLLATTACLLGSAGFIELAIRHPECRFCAITSAGEILRSL